MAIFSCSTVIDAFLAVVFLVGLLYLYMTATHNHWKKKGIPYVKPSMIFGNLKEYFLREKALIHIIQDIYNNLDGQRFGGYFEVRSPVLMVKDPDLIERILVTDFSCFSDRDIEVDLKREPLASNLFSLKGDIWKNLRNKITPTFTTRKLKDMFEQICISGNELIAEIEKSVRKNEAVDAKKLGSCFMTDVIASCAFGLQLKDDSLEGKQFRDMITELMNPSFFRFIEVSLAVFFDPLAKLLGCRRIPDKVNDYFINLVKETMQYREKNNIQRNDFLHNLINLKMQEDAGLKVHWKQGLDKEDAYLNQMDDSENIGTKVMTDQCIAAQTLVFLTAGSEAMSAVIAFLFFELAYSYDVQRRLQEEVDTVLTKYGGILTYDGIKEMTYLDLVIKERNRKYPESIFLRRVCNAPYTIPNTDIVLEKGTKIVIPIHAIQHDPTYYPDPDKYDPERFKDTKQRAGTFLTFGDGPRMCIAMRFVILEIKVAVAMVMSQYSIVLNSKTQIPFQYDPKAFNVYPSGGIWVNFEKRK
ncbi:cytochrome P450 6B1-like [Homalodisca vitripennis]|uniref:cytochrome P450 6B1-like n=1 Tax=Homalodisca vitripennis TaxID=197043 RepID=UPI001EEB3324|nr:cytochrome P450 6B1-like [Homalodisca vitripennis]